MKTAEVIMGCVLMLTALIGCIWLGCVRGAVEVRMDPPVLEEGAVTTTMHIPTTMPAVTIPSGMIELNLTFQEGAFQVPVGNTMNIGEWWWLFPVGFLLWAIPGPMSIISKWTEWRKRKRFADTSLMNSN